MLDEYRFFYQNEFERWSIGELGMKFCLTLGFFISLLLFIIPRKYWVLIPPSIILFYTTFIHYVPPTRMCIAEGGKKLVIKNIPEGALPNRNPIPPLLFVNLVGISLARLLNMETGQGFEEIKRTACHVFNTCADEVRIRLPSSDIAFPRKQILIVNHTDSPGRDAFSFFPFIPRTSKMIVVQHDFNPLVTFISRKLWGAWTINKDDKSPEGKTMLADEMEKILRVMREEKGELTVVIYPSGKVPKSCSECRNPGRFYPGAFYLSLLTGYPITTIINDYSPDGIFTTIVKEPVDLVKEYSGKYTSSTTVREFREENKKLLEDICERFRGMYVREYERLKEQNIV